MKKENLEKANMLYSQLSFLANCKASNYFQPCFHPFQDFVKKLDKNKKDILINVLEGFKIEYEEEVKNLS